MPPVVYAYEVMHAYWHAHILACTHPCNPHSENPCYGPDPMIVLSYPCMQACDIDVSGRVSEILQSASYI